MNYKNKPIEMVDLKGQYQKIKDDVDNAVLASIAEAKYINGPEVRSFEQHLAEYLGVRHVIGCANGTDALQIALMALGLEPGDEVIVPAFTYVATAEVIALLGLMPRMVDVDEGTFNLRAEDVRAAVNDRTRAVVPVHLFGQSCDMDEIMEVADEQGLFVIEDDAQAIGAEYNGRKTGTIGHIGCTSFFPSKNLGCYGDGGAIFTNDDELAETIRMIGNHGQRRKYYHTVIGVNSRLDTIQAAILDVKLKHLDEYCYARQQAAARYDAAFADIEGLTIPERAAGSTHVFHQYTLKVTEGTRDELKAYLAEKNVPSMIYYPLPLYAQDAFREYVPEGFELPVTEQLCGLVLSLPIHTEMEIEMQDFIIESVREFFASSRTREMAR
jgi:dTDP-4-amino-4,6-dideoxygalactose transaminase